MYDNNEQSRHARVRISSPQITDIFILISVLVIIMGLIIYVTGDIVSGNQELLLAGLVRGLLDSAVIVGERFGARLTFEDHVGSPERFLLPTRIAPDGRLEVVVFPAPLACPADEGPADVEPLEVVNAHRAEALR